MKISGKWIPPICRPRQVATLFLTIVLLLSHPESAAQWVIKNLDEDSYSYETCIRFKNDSLGLMMGTGAIVYRSQDVGETWDAIDVNIQVNIRDFQFVGESGVYAVGDDYPEAVISKLIRSADNGYSWDSIASFPGLQLNALYFLNNDTGLVAGYDAILRTADGGQTWDTAWSITGVGYSYGELVDITLPAEEAGYSIGKGRTQSSENLFENFILKSIDSGLSWNTIATFNQTLRTLFFIDSEKGYIGTEGGSIYRTSDGGLTWEESHVAEDLPILSVQFLSGQAGYATGGREVWSAKAGATGPETEVTGFHISRTLDGGDTWDTYDTTGIPLQSIHFIEDTIGFVSGLYGLIMKSSGEIAGLPGDYPWHLVRTGHIEEAGNKPEQIAVYPNPTSDEVFIRLHQSTSHPARIELYTVNGQKVFENQIEPGTRMIRLDMSRQAGSLFIIRIESVFGSCTGKIIKSE